jgi:membrane-bound lytic murein transglycosylase D
MKKILLSLLFISFFISSFAGNNQIKEAEIPKPLKDSIIKEITTNPRAGFKDLFEYENPNSNFSVKLNPRAIAFVEDYMENNTTKLTRMKSWGKRYFDVMDNILGRHGLPTQLKYLSVIESELNLYAVSWVGAVGPWQFMPETARGFGLRVTRTTDDRVDFLKSTHAAARYLTYLYSLYSDWLLVIAAYNGGPGRVNEAIKRSGSRNFWDLQYHLPAESRTHVKKFIATHYIMEGNGSVTTLTKKERGNMIMSTPLATNAPEADLEMFTISGRYNSLVIAQFTRMDMNDFNKQNPGFDKQLAATGAYNLRLPADKLLLFQAYKPQILEQSMKLMLASATKTF